MTLNEAFNYYIFTKLKLKINCNCSLADVITSNVQMNNSMYLFLPLSFFSFSPVLFFLPLRKTYGIAGAVVV